MVPRVPTWGWEMQTSGWPRLWRMLVMAAVAALTSGCMVWSTSSTTTVVTIEGPRGTLTFECRADAPMSGEDCQAWGERVQAHPDAVDAVRIVLTDRQGVGGCLADFQDADGVLYASASVDCP
jgi:hypothetical protein